MPNKEGEGQVGLNFKQKKFLILDEMEGLSVGELGRSPSPSGRTTPIPDVPTPTKSAPPPRPAPPPKRPPPIEEPKIVQVNAAPALSSLPPEFPPPALNINPPLNNYGWNDSTAESEWNAFDTGKQTGYFLIGSFIS